MKGGKGKLFTPDKDMAYLLGLSIQQWMLDIYKIMSFIDKDKETITVNGTVYSLVSAHKDHIRKHLPISIIAKLMIEKDDVYALDRWVYPVKRTICINDIICETNMEEKVLKDLIKSGQNFSILVDEVRSRGRVLKQYIPENRLEALIFKPEPVEYYVLLEGRESA